MGYGCRTSVINAVDRVGYIIKPRVNDMYNRTIIQFGELMTAENITETCVLKLGEQLQDAFRRTAIFEKSLRHVGKIRQNYASQICSTNVDHPTMVQHKHDIHNVPKVGRDGNGASQLRAVRIRVPGTGPRFGTNVIVPLSLSRS